MGERAINPEEIYECLVDEDLFDALPQRLAEAYSARSTLLHWHYPDGSAAILSHSGYFSDEQLQRYAVEFARHDPWAAASAQGQKPNTAINLEDLVSSREFEKSVFYNEYIRPMGDDTFRCMGIRGETPLGSGMIAIQRGKSQPRFAAREVASLGALSPHLTRALIIKGKLSAERRQRQSLEDLLAAMRDGAMIVQRNGMLIYCNAAAEALLRNGQALTSERGLLRARGRNVEQSLRSAIERACIDPAQPPGYLNVERDRWPPLVLSVTPMRLTNGASVATVLVHDPVPAEPALESVLQMQFRLTSAEAGICARLADGMSLPEIADQRGVSIGTVRGQYKTAAAKLGCSRQIEVALLVKSIPIPRS